MKFQKDDLVHVNSNTTEWGRIASDGVVIEPGKVKTLVYIGGFIRANILFHNSDICKR
jgi:hypothetical protein